jgi:putative hydrolase of the HAD superfamily
LRDDVSAAKRVGGSVTREDLTVRVEALVCDVGDVVILFDPAVSAGIEETYGLAQGSLLATLLKSPAGRLASVGAISSAQWLRFARSELPPRAVDEWLRYHGELNAPVVKMLATVRAAGVRLVFLSNATGRLWDDLAFHGISDLAEKVFCSASIGVAKPDPAAYRYAIEAMSLPVARSLYVDDTPSWVEAGRAVGLRGHVYVSAERLREELVRAGVPL